MINPIVNTVIVEALSTSALRAYLFWPSCSCSLRQQQPTWENDTTETGSTSARAGKYADALTAYDKAVFIRPNNADAWLERGVALENLGRYSDAVDSYDKAIVLQPACTPRRGITAASRCGNSAEYADAISSYDKAIAIRPSYVEALLNRGVALDYLGRYDEAIASYDRVLGTPAESHHGTGKQGHCPDQASGSTR